ncbi:fibroblast growth factor receptor 2-like [Planococcus citri]|uniref:fibroblast growth factor receptor 2-like n=1 Tax=Planococcus citri TaxID=170843 RepID=UPI0031F96E18
MRVLIFILICVLQIRFNWAQENIVPIQLPNGTISNITFIAVNLTIIEKQLPDFIENNLQSLGLERNWTSASNRTSNNFTASPYIMGNYPRDLRNVSINEAKFECPKNNETSDYNETIQGRIRHQQISWRIVDFEEPNLTVITKLSMPKNSTNNETYIVENPTSADDGFYMCIVHDDEEIFAARAAVLTVFDPPKKKNTDSYTLPIIIAIVSAVLIFVLLGGITIRYRRQKAILISRANEAEAFKNWVKTVIIERDGDSTDILKSPVVRIERKQLRGKHGYAENMEYELPPDTKWEFPREHLRLSGALGEGEFGKVVQGEAYNIYDSETWSTVAVKMLKDNHTDEEMVNMVAEVEIMKMIGAHKHVLRLLGCCSQAGPLLVIMEYAVHGNLRDFLRYYNSSSCDSTELEARFVMNNKALINFARQIAEGMDYLASIKCVHRDLAARNVLVCEDYIMKVADFGLARDIHSNEYYRKKSKGKLPVKWMAPEALFQRLYTCKSDIWSYGILLWEITTRGGVPYPSLPCIEKLFQLLQEGYRMESPKNCPPKLYTLMRNCWDDDPNERPDFQKIIQDLDEILADNDGLDIIPSPIQSIHSSVENLYSSSDEEDDSDGKDDDTKKVHYPLLKERPTSMQSVNYPFMEKQMLEKLSSVSGDGVNVRHSFTISEGKDYTSS